MLKSIILFCLIGIIAATKNDQEKSHKLNKENSKQYGETFFVPTWPSAEVLYNIGEIGGLGASEENIFIFHRGGRKWDLKSFNDKNEYDQSKGPIKEHTILVFSNDVEDNEVTASFGKDMFYMPHGLTVDSQQNVWVTDVALHQVMKFKPGSITPALVLGERFVPGSDDEHFCKPTHIQVASNGDFFVSDGYCNSRIMKFDKNGKNLAEWGNSKDGDNLNVPHHLALLEDKDIICVADRENNRVVCFCAGLKDSNQVGKTRFTISDKRFGRVYAIAYNPKLNVLNIMGGANENVKKSSIFVYDLAKKQVLDKFSYSATQGFGVGHAMASCPKGECLLVGSLDKQCFAQNPRHCRVSENVQYMPRNLWFFSTMDKDEDEQYLAMSESNF